MSEIADRLVIERDQLSGRLEGLRKFMGNCGELVKPDDGKTSNFMRLPKEMRNLMIDQEYHMTEYLKCLDKRLELLS